MKLCYLVALGLVLGSCSPQNERSAFFCRGMVGEGKALAFVAIREVSDGRVRFAYSGWAENGHHFGLNGVAEPVGRNWVYEDREPAMKFDQATRDWQYVTPGRAETPNFKVLINWRNESELTLSLMEPTCSDCRAAWFLAKPSHFAASDYVGGVKGELSESPEDFFDSFRCDEPLRRRHESRPKPRGNT